MISKELLSEVLEDIVVDIFGCRDGKTIRYYNRDRNFEEINIHELAFKCKEWAFSKGFSYIGNNGLLNINHKDGFIKVMTIDNETWYSPEIDFQACQWILQNLRTN